VLIYFDKLTQLSVARRACELLAPHGLLFLGHSEGLTGMDLQLEPVAHTVYRPTGHSRHQAQPSVPRIRAVSLDNSPVSRRRQYLIGSADWVRVSLNAGVLVVLWDPEAKRSCVAHFQQDCSILEQARRVESTLEGMLRELRPETSVRACIEAKVVAVCGASAAGETIDYQTILSVIKDCLLGAAIGIKGQRVFDEAAVFRLEMATGRVLVRPNAAEQPPSIVGVRQRSRGLAKQVGSL